MKKNITFAILTLAVLAGCKKETFSDGTKSRTGAVITVGISDTPSRTTIGPADEEGRRPVYWANGDAIAANRQASHALEGIEPGCRKVDFVFDEAVSYPCNFLYPASYSTGENTISIPEIQKFAPVVPMCAYSESETDAVTMAPVAAVLKIPVKLKSGDDPNKLKSIVITAANSNLAGTFTIDYATGALTPGEGGKKLKVSVNKDLSETEAVETYVVIPPSSGENYTVQIVDVTGKCMTRTLTNKNYSAGVVYALGELEFDPTGIAADVEISTAEEWNLYAESFNADPAAHQTDVVAIVDNLDFDGMTNIFIGSHYGGDNYVSGSILGNNHKIMNLHSSVPLVGSVNSNASITDLIIDGSCSFTVPYNVGTQQHFGPFAEYVKGKIENCHNLASITLSSNGTDNDKDMYIGGLVGRIREGNLVNCSNGGLITLDGTYKSTGKTYAGGIVGYMSNAEALVDQCSNNGTITTAALTNTAVLAGIGACVNGTVSNCTNDGVITSSMARPSGDACKFIQIGGIAGVVNAGAFITDNTNSVDITVSDAVKQNYIGGIAAQISGAGTTLSGNANSGNISSTGNIRNAYFGGLYGRISAETSIALTGSPFTGKISVSGYETSDKYYTYLYLGGIVGLSMAKLTVTGTDCSLASDITIPVSSSQVSELFMGGVVGAAGENGGGATVAGAIITISGITVTGQVMMTGSGEIPLYKKAAFGGILGGAFAGADISECTNKAKVYFCEAATKSGSNGHPAHLGGIAGRIEGGNSIISNCTSSGGIYNYLYNNNWWDANLQVGINAVGGIVGSFGYNKDQTYTLAMSNCSASGTCYGYRGTAGGIAGYLDKATLSGDISFTGSISRGAPAAGIAAIANECTISGCKVKSKTISGNGAGSCVGHSGGIVGLGMSTSVDDCKSFVTTTMTTGGTVGTPVAGGIIACPDANCSVGNTTACSYGGKVGSTTITADNVAQYAIGNTAITLGTVNYWDGN